MQKFTVFTIIFSTIVLTIVAELVIQDYLQKIYPPSSSLQASVATQDDFDFFYPDQEIQNEDLAEQNKDETNNVLKILEESRDNSEETASEHNAPKEETQTDKPSLKVETSVRVQTLISALDIEKVKYKPGTFGGKILDLVSTDDLPVKNIILGYFEVESVIGSFYEIETKNPLISETVYQELKNRFEQFPEIEINETNQFGEASLYINHSVKVNEVFILMKKDNYIYCFAYKKDYHDIFKNFFALLL